MHKAIVTGGTRGIGLAIAQAILAADGHVMVTGRSPESVRDALALLSPAAGGRVAGLPVDVRDSAAVNALVAETVKRFGGLDVVVNNAGVATFASVEETTDADWNLVIDTNLTGPFHVSRAAIPVLRAGGGGWIINIASLAARNAFVRGGAYCASKAALVSFSETLMQEVRYDNIRVSAILPGSVSTEFSGPRKDDDWKLTGEDVAEVVMGLLRHPSRSLPSRVELRPSKPKKS